MFIRLNHFICGSSSGPWQWFSCVFHVVFFWGGMLLYLNNPGVVLPPWNWHHVTEYQGWTSNYLKLKFKKLIIQQTFHKSSVSPLPLSTTEKTSHAWGERTCLRHIQMTPCCIFCVKRPMKPLQVLLKDRPLTPHETNMTLPLTIGRNPKGLNNIVFQSCIFRCYVC